MPESPVKQGERKNGRKKKQENKKIPVLSKNCIFKFPVLKIIN
jgi:hypothetical protein